MSSRFSSVGAYLARRQRMVLLVALVVSVTGFTGLMIELDDRVSVRFTSQVQSGLDWRAVHGAQELSKVSELGAAVSDPALFNKALDGYAASSDVEAIAVEVDGKILTSRGTPDSMAPVFEAEPGAPVRGDGFVASWAPAVARGAQVAKLAVVVSTQRLAEAQAEQIQTLGIILGCGGGALVLGALVIVLLTRRVAAEVHVTVAPVAAPAPEGPDLGEQLEERTHELDEYRRDMRLVLDHAAQGFLAVDLAGRLAGERSLVMDRWFGEPTAGATLAGYLSPYDRELAAQFTGGLDSVCAGELPLGSCLAQLPKQLTFDERTFSLQYAPLMRDDKPERILLIVSDITAQVAREREAREAREQRDVVMLAQLITTNREEYDQFFAEAAGLVGALEAPAEAEAEVRNLRTLKDNCAYYGLETFVELLQAIEKPLVESEEPLADEQRLEISNGWSRVVANLAKHLV